MNFPFEEKIILENERSRLEPMLDANVAAERLAGIALDNPFLMTYSPSDIHEMPLLIDYFNRALDAKAKKTKYTFLVFDKATNQYAGSTSFGNINDINSRIEIGWTWIGNQFQRTGLNRNNKLLMMTYVFETLAVERLEFKSDARNTASRKAMEGIGAQYEGLLRSHTIMSDGFRRGTVYYSILKEEWPTVKRNLLEKIR